MCGVSFIIIYYTFWFDVIIAALTFDYGREINFFIFIISVWGSVLFFILKFVYFEVVQLFMKCNMHTHFAIAGALIFLNFVEIWLYSFEKHFFYRYFSFYNFFLTKLFILKFKLCFSLKFAMNSSYKLMTQTKISTALVDISLYISLYFRKYT